MTKKEQVRKKRFHTRVCNNNNFTKKVVRLMRKTEESWYNNESASIVQKSKRRPQLVYSWPLYFIYGRHYAMWLTTHVMVGHTHVTSVKERSGWCSRMIHVLCCQIRWETWIVLEEIKQNKNSFLAIDVYWSIVRII